MYKSFYFHSSYNEYLNIHCTVEIGNAFWESDEVLKKKKLADVKKDIVPFYLDKLDAAAKENNGHLALGRVRIKVQVKSRCKKISTISYAFSWHGLMFICLECPIYSTIFLEVISPRTIQIWSRSSPMSPMFHLSKPGLKNVRKMIFEYSFIPSTNFHSHCSIVIFPMRKQSLLWIYTNKYTNINHWNCAQFVLVLCVRDILSCHMTSFNEMCMGAWPCQ